jgi:hypothetical protein
MIILRLALVSALIYVGFALAIEIALFTLAKSTGGSLLGASRPGWFVLFGVLWFFSFLIAFCISHFVFFKTIRIGSFSPLAQNPLNLRRL